MKNLNLSESMCQWIPKALSKVVSSKLRSSSFTAMALSEIGMLFRIFLTQHFAVQLAVGLPDWETSGSSGRRQHI